ncbi:acyltransferase [Vibrio coralliirubri]|uniref:acyltransferase n=1 Tax=Vibrio coralliirubri TaxID=1516159 RepID=UPI0013C409BC|nr:acyltransferase [Vibrio coralliirubri]
MSSFKIININGRFELGDNYFSGESLYISTNKYCDLIIEDKVMFGPEVMILGGNHNVGFSQGDIWDFKSDMKNSSNIKFERGCWIGARSLILSGALISEGSVIGAGSIVSHYIPPYVIAVGSPAKKYRARFSKLELETLLPLVNSSLTLKQIESNYKSYGIKFRE